MKGKDLLQGIDQVEILLKTLHWINRESHKRDILAQLDFIVGILGEIIRISQERKMASVKDIAKLELIKKDLSQFRAEVTNALSTQVGREAMPVLQKILEKDFEQFRKQLIAVLSKFNEKTKKDETVLN